MPVVSTSIKIDAEVKKQAQELFARLGLNLSTAVNIFLRQSIREQSLPFTVGDPFPPDTRAAMQEADDICAGRAEAKTYANVAELFREAEEEIHAEDQADQQIQARSQSSHPARLQPQTA